MNIATLAAENGWGRSVYASPPPTAGGMMPAMTKTKEEMWDELMELGVSEQTLQVVTNINGYNTETLENVLYAHTGYRSFDQLDDEDED